MLIASPMARLEPLVKPAMTAAFVATRRIFDRLLRGNEDLESVPPMSTRFARACGQTGCRGPVKIFNFDGGICH